MMWLSKSDILDKCGEDVRCILSELLNAIYSYNPTYVAIWTTNVAPREKYEDTLLHGIKKAKSKIHIEDRNIAIDMFRPKNAYVYIVDKDGLYVYVCYGGDLRQVYFRPHPQEYINVNTNSVESKNIEEKFQHEKVQNQQPETQPQQQQQQDIVLLEDDFDVTEISIRDLDDNIVNHLNKVPEKPCIYVLKCRDLVLYVGKAMNCRERLRRHLIYNSNSTSSLKERIAEALGIDLEKATRLLQYMVTRIVIYTIKDEVLEKLLDRYLRGFEKYMMSKLTPLLSKK